MKKNLHPKMQNVVFQDVKTGETFLVSSTMESADSVLWSDGNTYPLVKVEITSSSHPAYTGEERAEVTGSRKEAFDKKFMKREWIH